MNHDDAEEFTQSLGQTIGGHLQMRDGLHRLLINARSVGHHKALGLSWDEWVERVGGHVKYDAVERHEKVLELAAEGHSNRAIADALGVDETTIRRDIDGAANAAAEPIEASNGAEPESDGAANAAEHTNGSTPLTPDQEAFQEQERLRRMRDATFAVMLEIHTAHALFATAAGRDKARALVEEHGEEFEEYARLKLQRLITDARELGEGLLLWVQEIQQ